MEKKKARTPEAEANRTPIGNNRAMTRAVVLGLVVVSTAVVIVLSTAVAVPLSTAAATTQRGAPANTDPMATISREYVRLVLALGKHDRDYVDAYYGPEDLKNEAEAAALGSTPSARAPPR